jgi:hypothetical protein
MGLNLIKSAKFQWIPKEEDLKKLKIELNEIIK